MATATKTVAYSATLTPDAVDTVTITDAGSEINVINRSMTGTIWVRLGAAAADVTDPTVAGDNCRPVLGARAFRVSSGSAAVKLISDAALAYTVERSA